MPRPSSAGSNVSAEHDRLDGRGGAGPRIIGGRGPLCSDVYEDWSREDPAGDQHDLEMREEEIHLDHDRQVQESCPGPDVGDVRAPQPVRRIRMELPSHQVRRRWVPWLSDRCPRTPPAVAAWAM